MLTISDPDSIHAVEADITAENPVVGPGPTPAGRPGVPGAIGACLLRSTNPDTSPESNRGAKPLVGAKPNLQSELGSKSKPGSPGPTVRPSPEPNVETGAPRVAVNPKIARRRAEVRRTEHEIRRRRTLAGLGVAGVAALAVAVLFSPVFGVSRIAVTGTADPERVVDASGIKRGVPLVRISSGSVEGRLRALPEFAEVKVTKHWMRSISIAVVVREPRAKIVGPTNTVLIGENAVALASVPSTTTDEYNVPVLEGIAPASVGHALVGDAAVLARAAASLGPMARQEIRAIRMERGNVVLELPQTATPADGGGKTSTQLDHVSVVFGNDLELDLKGRALEAMLANRSFDGYRIADLGVPDAPVLGK